MKNVFCLLLILTGLSISAQDVQDTARVIQFSGMVVTEGPSGNIIPLPYTNVAIEGTRRGASSDMDGFFSFAALVGETVTFSRLGFMTVKYTIPDTLTQKMYSIVQIMTEDGLLLPETVIYPWPSKEHFEIEFMALDVTAQENDAIRENLSPEKMDELRKAILVDGTEATRMTIANQAQAFQYTGQFKPMKIFDIMAWKKFIHAWRNGDFKNEKKRKKIKKAKERLKEKARSKAKVDF